MLHFIYRDSLIPDDMLTASSSPEYSATNTHCSKLMAAADKYGLERLRLLCEVHLCKDISVDSVASILLLADSYHAKELKSACLKFAAENLGAVVRSSGFQHPKENCPSLQLELLKIIAGHEECGGKSQSVFRQLSDLGDSSGWRVIPRL
ncbi:hypothetical protein ZIOFF_036463 [Zingiber officinale]|uniref:BPM/SPOP BACK domain-containing protein n=1 Tax=Zingiber officinale TaxID=94328 RepID=A0A8J5GN16_ZINOF|nr:hypothetical protein ZIOFF_036463 [Zingiber officinale]